MFKIGYTIYCWLLLVLGFLSFTLLGFICWPFFKHKQQGYYSLAKLHLHCLFFLTAIKVNIHDTDKLPDDNVIIAANHQSLIDIFVLMAYFPKQITFFAKKELKKVPILNKDIEKMEHEFVDRNQSTKALEQLQKMGERLKRNFNILLFAEGTRSETGEVLPFKRGAFYLAATTKKNIIPCYIHGTNNVLRKNSKLFYPSKVTLSLGKMIKISDQQHLNDEKKLSKELQKVTYDAVLNLQKKILN